MATLNEQTARIVSGARGAASNVIGALGQVGRWVGAGLRHSAAADGGVAIDHKPPGSAPGIESNAHTETPPPAGAIGIQCVDFGPERIETQEVGDPAAFLGKARPGWSAVRWINVNGLHPYVVKRFMDQYGLHTLAAEDVLNTMQRPKMEDFSDHLFLVLRMITVEGGRLHNEQLSVFFFRDLVLTFQERAGDVWGPVRQRMQNPTSRLRTQGAGYLLYALLDAVVDHCFPILEGYGDLLEDLEAEVVGRPTPAVQQRIHAVKRELIGLRRAVWPLRDVLATLERNENGFFTDFVRTYLRDVYDHSIQVIDVVETYREMSGGLNDLYMSSVGNRMNEIMKVLTILSSFFIPITFVAGVYGMNFEHIPELGWRYSYLCFWLVCAVIVVGLSVYFWRKGWIGR